MGRVQSIKHWHHQIYLEVSEHIPLHLCILIVFRFDAVSQQDPAGVGGNNSGSGGHNDSLRSDNEKSFNILIEEGNNNSMLKNFDGPLDNNEMCSDVDDDDPEEDPEKLAELE